MNTKPTDAELEILNILWQEEPKTVREVHDLLKAKSVGYTTILKQLQVMKEKGLVKRDETNRSHNYYAAISQEQAQINMLDHILDKVFNGSKSALFMRALSAKPSSKEELAEIKAMLESLEVE